MRASCTSCFIATLFTLQKWRADQFLTILTIFIIKFLPFITASFEPKTCLKIPQLLPTFEQIIFVTYEIEIHTLSSIFNDKELKNFKVRPTPSILNEMDDGWWKVFSGINAMKLVTQN